MFCITFILTIHCQSMCLSMNCFNSMSLLFKFPWCFPARCHVQLKIKLSPETPLMWWCLLQILWHINERDAVSPRVFVTVGNDRKLHLFSLVSLFSNTDTAEKESALLKGKVIVMIASLYWDNGNRQIL